MRCREVERKISRVVDGRALPGEARVVSVHLESCARCRTFAQLVGHAHVVLAQLPRIDASAGLADRAFRAAMNAPAPTGPMGTLEALFAFARPGLGLAAALSAGLALVAWLSPGSSSDGAVDPLAQLSQVATIDATEVYGTTLGPIEER